MWTFIYGIRDTGIWNVSNFCSINKWDIESFARKQYLEFNNSGWCPIFFQSDREYFELEGDVCDLNNGITDVDSLCDKYDDRLKKVLRDLKENEDLEYQEWVYENSPEIWPEEDDERDHVCDF